MDLLWKKDLYGELVDIFANVDLMDELSWKVRIMAGVVLSKKKNESSTKYREQGNKEMQESQYYEAMLNYNISLCYAEVGTDNVSLAYANRSLCFLKMTKYDKCLIDIELAVKAGYPQQSMGKLEQRRKFCLERIKNASSNDSSEPKLDFDAHENFPGLSMVVQMECNKKFGRHFVAKSDINAGKVVMVEEAFVTASHPEYKMNACEACFRHARNFIACPNCNGALFCDQICADDFTHVWKCGRQNKDDNFLVEFTLRSVIYAMTIFDKGFDDLRNFVKEVIQSPSWQKRKNVPEALGDMPSRYRMFLELNLWLSAAEKSRMIQTGYEGYRILMQKDGMKEFFSGQDNHFFLKHLFVMHASIVYCNIFQTEAIGSVWLLKNHFNHSCAPNVLTSWYENKSVAITSRPIKKGDQLFVSYGKQYFVEPRSIREAQLWEDFGFHCECEKCGNDEWPVSSTRIESDPDYQFLVENSKDLSVFEVGKRLSLKRKCVDILVKYSDAVWCTQLDVVSHLYEHLSTETLF